MAALKFLLAVALLCLAASSANAQQVDAANYVCPGTGPWVPFVSSFFSSQVSCVVDACYGSCGAGNTCVTNREGFSGVFFQTNTCTCKAPSVLSHVIYNDFCYVPGTDVCNPNPCKNGATCKVLTDFNGAPGAYQCTNCPTNIFGRNCDVIGPPPVAIPRGMPTGGSNPYTTF